MQTSIDKLHDLRNRLEPQLEAMIRQGKGGATAGVAIAFARPMVEAKVDELLSRSPDDVDEILVGIIDIVAGHLSDTARPVAAGPGGVDAGATVIDYIGHRDPVRAPDALGGSDPHR